MYFLELYTLGLPLVLNFHTIIMLLIGVISGIVIGALPGLTATMSVAVMLPLTFGLNSHTAFALLLGAYCGGIYGGSITAVLAKIPGTPAAMMTTLDGYPMGQKGQAGKAIGIATVASFIGGLVSVFILSIFAPAIANIALEFSAQEYFSIGIFALSIIAYISPGSMVKGLLAGCIGLLLSTIGMDPVSGYSRYTFNTLDLLGGLELLPVLIGIFGLAEVLRLSETKISGVKVIKQIGRVVPKIKEFKKIILTIIRSSTIGVFIGAVPAAGATMASIVAYGMEKRLSHYPEKFGTGIPEGIAAPEAANNACTGGAMIPMLSLGIPGDPVTAILIGALLIHGLRPGPLLFKDNPEFISSIFILMAMANFVFLGVGLLGAKIVSKVITVPLNIMLPIILVLCTVGTYAIRNSIFDLGVLIVFGVVGYLFNKGNVPPSPLVLGFILGPIIEQNLRRALILSRGNFLSFFIRPISALFLILTVIILVSPYIIEKIRFRKNISHEISNSQRKEKNHDSYH